MQETWRDIRPRMITRRSWHLVVYWVASFVASACSGNTEDIGPKDTGTAGSGGSAATGGSGGGGGASGSGTVGGSGGTAGTGSGGIAGSSGAAGKSGAAGTGGTAGAGGAAGAAGSGGAAGTTGGAAGSAGAGRDGAAGSSGTAGSAGSGADASTGTDAGKAGDADVRVDAPGGTVVFGKNVRVNDDTGTGRQSEVALATGAGMLLAGWMDERATRICAFSFSSDGGLTWSKNVSIPNLSGGSFVGDPAVAIDGGGTMYAVCQQYGTGQIRLMTSIDKGVTWSAIRSVQSAPDKPWAGGGTAEGTVFLSWLGSAAGIKRSLDRGLTWGTIQPLGNIIHGTAIVTSTTGLVHVPYNLDSANNQLRYLRSKDNGVTYDAYRDLVADMGRFCFGCMPRQHPIVGAASDSTGKFVAITWSSVMPGGQSDDDVWLLYSKDSGDTWTRPLRVNDNTNTSRQFESWVAVDEFGRVHVAWTDLRNGQNETWYTRSADPAAGFEPNLQITDGRGSAATDFLGDYKGIVVQGSDVIVVWQDTRTDRGDIYAARAAGAASFTGAAQTDDGVAIAANTRNDARLLDPTRLPEDPVAGKASEAQWRAHMEREERERRLNYDRRKLGEHEVVFTFIKNARARYDRAKTAPLIAQVQASLVPQIAQIRKRVVNIDRWGVNSNLLEDYAALLAILTSDYPAARIASVGGASQALGDLRAHWAQREQNITGWLEEAAESEDE
jgi:hypothetical protein